MKKLKVPKNARNGIKVWCRKCRQNNTDCNHYEDTCYRVSFIDPITGKHRSKMLLADNYEDAFVEAIEFKKNKDKNNLPIDTGNETGNDYTLAEAILKYDNYLNGDSQYQHLKRKVTDKHRKEVINYCKKFNQSIKDIRKVKWIKPSEVNRKDVSNFYSIITNKYYPKTVNKINQTLKTFFNFLIETEDVEMKNHFSECISLSVPKKQIISLTKAEFDSILSAIDTYTPLYQTTKSGRMDNVYYPWLKNAFKLFLFVGGRREEVLNLRWSDIFISEFGTKFFIIRNLKVERIQKNENVGVKLAPIGVDFEELLKEMGMEEKKGMDEKLIDPENRFTTGTLMEKMTDAFTHYRNGAGIEKPITLKHLRKTYLTWTHQALGESTGKVSSHAGTKVLKDYYLDPQVLNTLELAALKVKIFG